MNRRKFLKLSAAAASAALVPGCDGGYRGKGKRTPVLGEYYLYKDGRRMIFPQDYIDYLKSSVFTHGELDNLPKSAVILHDCKVEEHLKRLGFSGEEYSRLETGTTDPNLMYIVRNSSGIDFILNRGLPGAGGIATQAAELYALGVERIVHIGTCGLLGRFVNEGEPILSAGAYRDAAAVMLCDSDPSRTSPIIRPSSTLMSGLELMLGAGGAFSKSVGYTIPVYYFQPEGLMAALIRGEAFPLSEIPGYVEMEAASLFQTADLMQREAASMVVGADRYVLREDGNVSHEFHDVDCDSAKSKMLDVAISALSRY
jgi:hypothetical protein